MSKRKQKRTSRPQPARDRAPSRPAPVNLDKHLRRAENLIDHNRYQDAIDLLEPLLESHPRAADLHYYLGYAYVQVGRPVDALDRYEQGMALRRDPDQWESLASLYTQLGLMMHAIHALRQVARRPSEGTEPAYPSIRIPQAEYPVRVEALAFCDPDGRGERPCPTPSGPPARRGSVRVERTCAIITPR